MGRDGAQGPVAEREETAGFRPELHCAGGSRCVPLLRAIPGDSLR